MSAGGKALAGSEAQEKNVLRRLETARVGCLPRFLASLEQTLLLGIRCSGSCVG